MKLRSWRPLLALSLALAIAGSAGAEEPDPLRDLLEMCARVRCHMPGTLHVNLKDGATAEYRTEFPYPIVHNGLVSILPGNTLYIAAEIEAGPLVNMRVVDEPEKPANALKFRMWQEEGEPDTFLTVTNYFPSFIKYRANMMVPMGNDIYPTSSCPVLSDGRAGYEHWPHPIFQLLLDDFHVVAAEGDPIEIVCE